jgi:ABC-type nitrate/sulfonate/bicarbonate transport system substrate-binding protein
MKGGPEAPDAAGITTVKEYTYVPGTKLPDVKGAAAYTPMADNTVRMALNVWAGWAPVIYANDGFNPGKVWKAPNGKSFKLQLVLIDDPIAMRDAYASGKVHIGWATLDMIPLFVEALRKDSRTMPRVYQQIDWSNGGDGIVCRQTVKSVSDMRGKTVVLAQNSPSHFFLLNTLISGGVQPSEVQYKFTQDAFQAAAAFNADKSVACVVSWAPDIYNLAETRGNRMLVNTQTANKLIADVWFARADFAKDHPEIMEGLARGIFEAMEALKTQDAKAKAAKLMAVDYKIPGERRPLDAERRALDQLRREPRVLPQSEQPHELRTHVEHGVLPLWEDRQRDGEPGAVRPGDGFLDHPEAGRRTVIREPEERIPSAVRADLRDRGAGREQRDSHQDGRHPVLPRILMRSTRRSRRPSMAKRCRRRTIRTRPSSSRRRESSPASRRRPHRDRGSHDASMRGTGTVTAADVQELSLRRANAVKQALLRKFPTLQPNQFTTVGRGWDRPADPGDPGNAAKNRRVEIKVYPLESK